MSNPSKRLFRKAATADLVSAVNAHTEAALLFHSAIAQRMGLDPTAYKALFALRRLGSLSAGEMSVETGLTPAAVTDLIDRLVSKGFVTRQADTKDRRRILVSLCEEAILGVRPGFGIPNPSLVALADRYDADQLALIAEFLRRNAQRLRDDLVAAQATSPAPMPAQNARAKPKSDAGFERDAI